MTQKFKDPMGAQVLAHFTTAIAILDSSEGKIRDLIENSLSDNTMKPRVKGGKKKQVEDLTRQIMAVRVPAIKAALRHLRDNLPSGLQPN